MDDDEQQRDCRQEPIGPLLKLRGADAEQHFWTSGATARQTQLFDSLGLGSGLVVNLTLATSAAVPRSYQLCCCASVAAITSQLLWSLCHARSYVRCRTHLMAAQRFRWFFMASLLNYTSSSAWGPALSQLGPHLSGPGPVTWRAFAAVGGYPPLALVHQSLSFPLPFRYALASSVIILAWYPGTALKQQVRVVQLLGLQRYAGPACMATPVGALLPEYQHLCSTDIGHTLLLAYLFVLVGVLLPLQLVYWQERSAKEAYLRARGVATVQRGGGSVLVMLLLTLWAILLLVLAAATA